MNWGVCALLAASVGLAACGGRTEDDDATATDGATDAIDDSDAGFTACSGPSGQKLCGGKCGESCSSDQCGSTDVFPFPDAVAPDAALGVCFDGPGVHGGSCNQCADGLLCVPDDVALTDPDPAKGFANLSEADPGYAVMYDLNGMGNLVRYADRSGYSGKAIPDTPAGCPEDIGFQVCGGSCGA